MSKVKQFHLREGTLVEGKSLGCLNVYLASDYDQIKADNEAYKKLHDWLKAENERLANCLRNANESAEKFERDWYLVSDERDTLRKQLDEAKEHLVQYSSYVIGTRTNKEIDDWLEANRQ